MTTGDVCSLMRLRLLAFFTIVDRPGSPMSSRLVSFTHVPSLFLALKTMIEVAPHR
jgi:hypothetical protein